MSNTEQGFKSLLAPNASKLEQAHERATYFDDVKQIPDYVAKLWHPDTCPEKLLPWLAWSLSVDDWDEHWPVEAKRALIKNSVAIHKHKGTVGAVKRALKSLGVVIEFFEWFEDVDNTALIPVHSKEPNTFTFMTWANEQVYTSQQVALSDALYKAINRVTNQTKPQRAHFNFLVGAKLDLGITVATTSSGLQVRRINYDTLPVKAAPSEITAGLTVSSLDRLSVNRQRGSTKAVEARLQDSVAFGLHLHNQRHTVGRFYMLSEQKLPAGCYYLQSELSAGLHLNNRRFTVGRFYLYPNK
ncbi:phage tail protein I [Pseudoalteromonas sp. S16_S37]|uniref:phage tail protein I n=1 Tax=Pseudoalteromonas sp. S16_S37 TaxID=2720228 RepID=UPI001680C246|nr:phage tail protein I [Pseudoalteromonas sp. S16_S37]MBD1582489.1 phage tail protein I [Pseudoalteromonas sp. S16_S37]